MVLQKGKKVVKHGHGNVNGIGDIAANANGSQEASSLSSTAETVRERCKKTISNIYQLHPHKVKQFCSFVQTCSSHESCQAALEGIVMGAKSAHFNRCGLPWHFLMTCR